MKKEDALKIAKDFKCYNQSVLVLRDIGEAITETGLIIADTEFRPQVTGTILAFSPNCKNKFTVGERIKFNHFENTEMYHNGITFLAMHEQSVLFSLPDDCIDNSMGTKKRKRIDIKRPDTSIN